MKEALQNLANQIIDLIKGFGVEGGILEIIRDFFNNIFGGKKEA